MIRYTLACDAGHAFESWFPSAASYDAQAAGGLVACPVCGSGAVVKAPMAPAVARTDRGRRRAGPGPAGNEAARTDPGRSEGARDGAGRAGAGDAASVPSTVPPESGPAVPMIAEPERQLRALLRAVREHVTRTADDVGTRFPEAARAMHYGEAPVRAIYGEASPSEARALIEEGIEVAPLPPAPDDRH